MLCCVVEPQLVASHTVNGVMERGDVKSSVADVLKEKTTCELKSLEGLAQLF